MSDELERSQQDQDEDMAAEWAAMIEDEPEEDKSDFNSLLNLEVLSQEGIDNVLGYKYAPQSLRNTSGIKALANSDLVNSERLPLLEIIYDRLVRLMTTSLRNFTSDSVEVSMEGVESVRIGDYLNQVRLPAVISVFRAEEWDNFGILSIEADLMYSVVDVLLGGRRVKPPVVRDTRPYTSIEMNLAERLARLVLMDAEQAFRPVANITFNFNRMENDPRFATIGRPTDAGIVARFRVDMENRSGYMDMLVPLAMLEPIREHLSQMFMGEKFGHDTMWEEHLSGEIQQSQVELQAVLSEQYLTLSELLNIQVGDTLDLKIEPGTPIDVRCGSATVIKGAVGQKNDHMAVSLNGKPNIQAKDIFAVAQT